MMYFMKLVEYKHLLVSLKIKNKKVFKNKVIKDCAKTKEIIHDLLFKL